MRRSWHQRREDAGQVALPLSTVPDLPPLHPQTPPPASVPFSGRSPQSRHHSHQAAQRARAKDGSRPALYLALLAAHGPLSDHESARRLGCPLSSINGLRNRGWIRKLVEEVGKTTSPNGSPCSTWGLKTAPAATKEM
jgi:hypothetical protein